MSSIFAMLIGDNVTVLYFHMTIVFIIHVPRISLTELDPPETIHPSSHPDSIQFSSCPGTSIIPG